MSTNELLPLFPSQLHPALPIAVQLLSTLRSLTAPGRGNDIRPEERAALVGVAALMGCEKVQSKDLSEKSAQKACSVSPAHFRSALTHARRLLKTVDSPSLDASSSTRRSTRSSDTSPSKSQSLHVPDLGLVEGEDVTPANTSAPSPFTTPKKKFKFSSGIDISSLVRNTPKSVKNPHEPSQSSPLRHSVTPSKRPQSPDKLAAADTEDVRTPTKRVKYVKGVDLEHVDVPAAISSTRKRKEDPSAFLALRPGAVGSLDLGSEQVKRKEWNGNIPIEDGLPDVRPPRVRRTEAERSRMKLKERMKRDWRYPETVWGADVDRQRDEVGKILQELPAWLEANGMALKLVEGDIEDVLLGKMPPAEKVVNEMDE